MLIFGLAFIIVICCAYRVIVALVTWGNSYKKMKRYVAREKTKEELYKFIEKKLEKNVER